jgi:acylaminoacyl-peptidase
MLDIVSAGKDFEAMLVTSEVNVMANSKRKYQSFVNIPKGIIDKPSCNWSAFPVQLSGVSLVVPSKSGNKLLIIRNGESEAKDKPNPTKLEIWNSAQLLKEIVIPASVHGPVYTDGW